MQNKIYKKKINHICCGVTTYSYKVCIQMNYLEQLQYVKCNASNYEYIKGSLGSDSPCYPFFSFRTPIFFPFFPHCGAWSQAIIKGCFKHLKQQQSSRAKEFLLVYQVLVLLIECILKTTHCQEEKTSWLFISVVEELNQRIPRK